MILSLSCIVLQPSNMAEARSSILRPVGFNTLFSTLTVSGSQTTAGSQAPATSDQLPLPEGKGRDLTKASCSKCHGTNVFAAQRHTREQWSSIIDNMVSKGLEATDDDLDQITEYLTVAFPPIKKDATNTPPPTVAPN